MLRIFGSCWRGFAILDPDPPSKSSVDGGLHCALVLSLFAAIQAPTLRHVNGLEPTMVARFSEKFIENSTLPSSASSCRSSGRYANSSCLNWLKTSHN